MTAHRSKPTITPEIVARFAAYYAKEPAWGVCHVVLDDCNYKSTVSEHATNDEEREIAAILDAFTPTQRRRLGNKAEAMVRARR